MNSFIRIKRSDSSEPDEPAPTGTLVIGENYATKDDVKAIAEAIPLSNFELPEGSVDMNN